MNMKKVQQELGQALTADASISEISTPRWSTYKAPEPIAVVHPAAEEDIVETVKFCNSKGWPFVVQGGGNGWAEFSLSPNTVLIDLSTWKEVIVAADKKTAKIIGGATIKETIAAANAAGVVVQTGNCNSVGTIGALLGGGYGNTLGLFGFGVDNILEFRVLTADGEVRTVSESQNPDLFWAMRGAGPNFGIVISATLKSYVLPEEERSAWSGALVFTGDKLDQVAQALQDLELSPEMVSFMYFASLGQPGDDPVIIVTLWQFQGTPETGRASFSSFFEIGPVADTTSVVPYTRWNEPGDPFCTKSERKPGYSAGLNSLHIETWRQIWDKFVSFQSKPGAHRTAVLLETFPMYDLRHEGRELTAFPHRDVRFQAIVIPWYNDPTIDDDAVRFGKDIREMWHATSGFERNRTYVNFAHGDEPLEEIYGDSLERLKKLKRKWDPENRFFQWFNIR